MHLLPPLLHHPLPPRPLSSSSASSSASPPVLSRLGPNSRPGDTVIFNDPAEGNRNTYCDITFVSPVHHAYQQNIIAGVHKKVGFMIKHRESEKRQKYAQAFPRNGFNVFKLLAYNTLGMLPAGLLEMMRPAIVKSCEISGFNANTAALSLVLWDRILQ